MSQKQPAKIVMVSNRGSYNLQATRDGIQVVPAISGLVSAVEPFLREKGGVWVAWGGREAPREDSPGLRLAVPEGDPAYTFREVPLTADEIDLYYHGFTNSALWPLCHYFLEKCRYEVREWSAYVNVNAKFAEATLEEAGENDTVWVNDYHLALVPAHLRHRRPQLKQFFFWHIPFPHHDLLATLPWATHILRGLLGTDVLGFHLQAYVDNFLQAVAHLLGARVDFEANLVFWKQRRIHVGAWPMGIDYQAFQHQAASPATMAMAQKLRAQIGVERLALSVERLDYTKGILERLLAWERLLEEAPEWRGRAALIQVAVPSRTAVPAYRQLKEQVEATVGRINGRFSDGHYQPVYYFWRGIPRRELVAYYLAADVMLVTPLRDGLNLVAKEYVASRRDQTGVLVLSRFAGAAQELKGAVLVNPYDIDGMAMIFNTALGMGRAEQSKRLQLLQERVRRHDVHWWMNCFHQVMTVREGETGDVSGSAGS
ncbi:MAG: trehalose 6-phosphate synthase/phosphatase [Moorella sp. (in: firmicutes)]|uniref:Glucosylglycerol-phosphate synthase n=1 Tax=Neomoorella thermoacetica TaxID=1525 RepID=A0A1J5NY49_NEOTH|nr:trehalose 6-phosphate synthase/phosphatase [Moorella sp. (in: firmicutes)]OIQ60663.1 trehalose-phosphate synthase [Moorella thermoacetica]